MLVLTIVCSDDIAETSKKLVDVQSSTILTRNKQMIGRGDMHIDLLLANPLCLRVVGLRSAHPTHHTQDMSHPPGRRNSNPMLFCETHAGAICAPLYVTMVTPSYVRCVAGVRSEQCRISLSTTSVLGAMVGSKAATTPPESLNRADDHCDGASGSP